MERSAAPLVEVIDAGPGAHQSKQALIVAVGGSIVQRGPGKANRAQFPLQNEPPDVGRTKCCSIIECCKPAKAVLSVKVCSRVEEEIETFQVPEWVKPFIILGISIFTIGHVLQPLQQILKLCIVLRNLAFTILLFSPASSCSM